MHNIYHRFLIQIICFLQYIKFHNLKIWITVVTILFISISHAEQNSIQDSVEVIRIGPDSTVSSTTTQPKKPKSWENLDVLNVYEIRGVQDSKTMQNPTIKQSKANQPSYTVSDELKHMITRCTNNDKIACQQALAFADKHSTQCNLNSTEVCRTYASIFLIHNQRQKALNARQIACNGDNATACIEAWQLHKTGKGIKKDSKQGFALLKRSCDFKNADACYELAETYRTGIGVELNLRKAKELYSKSCDLGNSDACDAYNEFL